MDPLTQDIDHRKKRRNRTTHSCINCHTTKRKCDRKRPCQRCTQLGLTGLCVYEVDDPSMPDDPNVDEATRLRKRIAELEGVIRELKNKPHPRWISQAQDAPSSFHTRSLHVRTASLSKKRKLDDLHGKDIVDLSLLPDGPSPSAASPIKLEPHSGDLDHMDPFDLEAYDARYSLPEFGIQSDDSYPSSGSPHHSAHSGGSPRMYRFNDLPISPSNCECLNNTVAFHSLTDLESHLRSAIHVLSNLRHSPQSETGPTETQERCALYAEIARLQDLIVASTRPTTPMVLAAAHPPQQQRLPLSVTVPMAFQETISQNLPPGFTLRAPPTSASNGSSGSLASPVERMPHTHPHQPTPGIMTPPLSSHGGPSYPWDAQSHTHSNCSHGHSSHSSHSHSPSPPITVPSHAAPPQSASPALSSVSTFSGSSGAGAFIVAPRVPSVPSVPSMMTASAAAALEGFPQYYTQSHARFAPPTPGSEYDFSMLDTFHNPHTQAFGNMAGMIRTTGTAGAY